MGSAVALPQPIVHAIACHLTVACLSSHTPLHAYIVGNDIPGGVAVDLHPHSGTLAGWVLVEKVSHDAALVDLCAIDAGGSCIDVVVDHIQL